VSAIDVVPCSTGASECFAKLSVDQPRFHILHLHARPACPGLGQSEKSGAEPECKRIDIYQNPILQEFALSSYSFVLDSWNNAETELIFLTSWEGDDGTGADHLRPDAQTTPAVVVAGDRHL
jgi:hypothetical protein